MYFELNSIDITNEPFMNYAHNDRLKRSLIFPQVDVQVSVTVEGVNYTASYRTESSFDLQRWQLAFNFEAYNSKNMEDLFRFGVQYPNQINANTLLLSNTKWLDDWLINQPIIQALMFVALTNMTDPVAGKKSEWTDCRLGLDEIYNNSQRLIKNQRSDFKLSSKIPNEPTFYYFSRRKMLVAFSEISEFFHITPFVSTNRMDVNVAITDVVRRLKKDSTYSDLEHWGLKPFVYSEARYGEENIIVHCDSPVDDYNGIIKDSTYAISNRDSELMAKSTGEPCIFSDYAAASKWIDRHEMLGENWRLFLA